LEREERLRRAAEGVSAGDTVEDASFSADDAADTVDDGHDGADIDDYAVVEDVEVDAAGRIALSGGADASTSTASATATPTATATVDAVTITSTPRPVPTPAPRNAAEVIMNTPLRTLPGAPMLKDVLVRDSDGNSAAKPTAVPSDPRKIPQLVSKPATPKRCVRLWL
jgi:hypothetical protein